ncbi:hypothetical protein LguiB_009731 [Lonicera macranthoides]
MEWSIPQQNQKQKGSKVTFHAKFQSERKSENSSRAHPMTAFERQRNIVKHVVTGLKQYGKRKNPTPPALESTIPELPPPQLDALPTAPVPLPAFAPESEPLASPPPAPANLETEISTQGKYPNSASQEDDDGGPIDKSMLRTFKDRIAYAIWNREDRKKQKLSLLSIVHSAHMGRILSAIFLEGESCYLPTENVSLRKMNMLPHFKKQPA